jgi:acetyltransferase-like isoleucine patch superfamily enzyme
MTTTAGCIKRFNLRTFCRCLWYDGRPYLANRIIARVPSHRARLLFNRAVMKVEIGKNGSNFMDAWFDTVGNIVIGTNSTINQRCKLDGRGGLTIGSNASISAEVCILTGEHNIRSSDFCGRASPVRIEDYAFVGTRAMILPGVSLGKGAVVAAGAVVTKDVEPFTVVADVPARELVRRNSILEYSVYYRCLFY